MVELFTDIPEYIKVQSKFWVDLALSQDDPLAAIQMLESYRSSCLNEREKEFVDFYFNMRVEDLSSNT
jgi:hypothetical protein